MLSRDSNAVHGLVSKRGGFSQASGSVANAATMARQAAQPGWWRQGLNVPL
jgi:hypothetical protein